MPEVYPVIISGGAGTRLWPLSRTREPKPFLRLADGQSLMEKAYWRALALPGVAGVVTVTGEPLRFLTRALWQSLSAPVPHTLLLEPAARNTGPAIALATLAVAAQDPDAVLLVTPADHVINDRARFAQAMARGLALAQTGKLVTFGIRPTAPETGYGYIEAEGETALRFVEKPDRATAEAYLASGRFLWNAGLFAFSAAAMRAAMARHCPDLWARAEAAFANAARDTTSDRAGDATLSVAAADFEAMPAISIDYAVMEKADTLAVVAADFGWSDVGTWPALAALTPPDAAGNRAEGEALFVDSQNTYVRGARRLVAAVGVRDLVIVDTPDALLVAAADKAQAVKGVAEALAARNDPRADVHSRESRPWGSFEVLDEGQGFKVKRIEVAPGGRLSLQSHRHRAENWVVVAGVATVERDEDTLTLLPGQHVFIPQGAKHRLANLGEVPMALIEVQAGDYLGEDDITRYEDIYGRR